jgi:hypothetical protein
MCLRGDLNLQAKPLMLLGSNPPPKTNPSNLLRLLGFYCRSWLRGQGLNLRPSGDEPEYLPWYQQ